MEYFPQTKDKYEPFRSFAHLQKDYPWAKAIVIASFWYGKYRIPNNMQEYVAKYYLTDGRRNPSSQGYQTSIRFEKYLTDCGFQVETERDFGITALRWAGMEAGIGIIRKNNFFYTEIVLSDYNWLRSVVQPNSGIFRREKSGDIRQMH